MGRLLRLSVEENEMVFSDFASFYESAKKFNVPNSSKVTTRVDGGKIVFGVDVPDPKYVPQRKKKEPKKTKKQLAVEKQIQEHQEKKAKGIQEAYVPPVGRKTPPKPMRVKCPSCDVRKRVVKQGSISVIKPHITKGEPCSGSGVQVKKEGRVWKVVS